MHLIQAFVQNPVKVAAGVLLVLLFGLDALFRLPMQLTPEVQTPQITVETRWPGASPQEVEREIIQEQEEQLKSVEGVTKMTSESKDSRGEINLEFVVGTDMQEALLKVNSRLQQVPEYPEDAEEPVISTSDINDRSIAWFILGQQAPTAEEIDDFAARHPQLADALAHVRDAHTTGVTLMRLRRLANRHPEVLDLLSRDIDLTKFRRFAEDFIEARFERVPGVSNSNVIGGLEDECQVIVDPNRLAARQLTIHDVRDALRGQNKDTSGGDFWEGKRRYVVRTLGQFRSEAQVASQLIAIRDGAPVYVGDVAEVRLGYKKPDGLIRRFGTSSIAINVQRETGANVLDVMEGLRRATKELNEGPLQARGLLLTQSYDETDYIYSAVGLVNQNILIGGLLTVAVLLLFLRSGRSTLVIGLAIPTSIIGTFLMLDILDRSLNVISLAGLAFAVGMLVDNAVVVLENIYRRYSLGESPATAAVRGTGEVWGAVAASTLTTLAVFLPVLFVQEEAGQLFRDIALAISSAVGLSLIVSVTVIPTAAARLLARRSSSASHDDSSIPAATPARESATAMPHRWLRGLDRTARSAVSLVVGINAWTQKSTPRRLSVVAILIGLSGLLTFVFWPKVEYLPTGNRNLVFAMVLPPPGYNNDQLMELGASVEAKLEPYWNVDPKSPEARDLAYPPIEDFFFVARGSRVFMGVRSADPTECGQYIELLRQVGRDLPGTIVTARQSSLFERGSDSGRNIDIEITGPDLNQLVRLGGSIMQQCTGTLDAPGVVPDAQVRPIPSLDLSTPEVHVVPKLIQAAEMGVDSTDLGYTVDALVDGAYATDYYIGGDKIDLRIIGVEKFADQTHDLPGLPVATPGGQLVLLSALADVQISSGPQQINRRERQRAITIQVSPPPTVALEEAMDRIEQQIVAPLRESGELAGGYAIRLSGTVDKLRSTWQSLNKSFWFALLITYLLMAALFESWLYPLVIILSVPLGMVGGLAGLKLLNGYLFLTGQLPQALDVLTMLGFVILIGTVVNNAILIVHQSLNHMRYDVMLPGEAILESVRNRVRPIFMTTATTVLGLAPLVLFPGAGSELYRGLGSVVLGGLLCSTVFTLVLVPTLFSLVMQVKNVFAGRRLRDAPSAPVPSATAPSVQ